MQFPSQPLGVRVCLDSTCSPGVMAFIPLLHHLLTFSHSSLLLRIVPRCRCVSWCPFWCSMLVLIASVTLDLTTLHRFNIKNGHCECLTNRQTGTPTHLASVINGKALSGALQVGQKQQNGQKKGPKHKEKSSTHKSKQQKEEAQLIARLADTLHFSQRYFIKKLS